VSLLVGKAVCPTCGHSDKVVALEDLFKTFNLTRNVYYCLRCGLLFTDEVEIKISASERAELSFFGITAHSCVEKRVSTTRFEMNVFRLLESHSIFNPR